MSFEKPPKVKIDVGKHAVTFNPHDAYQYADNSDRYDKFINTVCQVLYDALDLNDIDYTFYVELSEPSVVNYLSLGPRLHIHGVINLDTPNKVFNYLLKGMYIFSRYGNLKTESLTDESKWDTYCLKQQHIINKPPIVSSKNRVKALRKQEKQDAQRAIDNMFNVTNINCKQSNRLKGTRKN